MSNEFRIKNGLIVSGSANFELGVTAQSFTGSFSGTIQNATSASYASTASYALNAGDSVWTGSAGNIYYSGGNVGIGTASPNYSLEILGSPTNAILNLAKSDGDQYLRLTGGSGGGNQLIQTLYNLGIDTGGAGNRTMTLLSSGNVGIGTTAPAVKLEIKTATSSDTSVEGLRIYNAGGGVGAGVRIGLGVGTTYSEKGHIRTDIVSGGAGRMFFGVNGSDVVTINNSGNVGIGTTSPTTKFHVLSGTLNSAVATFSGANLDRGLKISTFNSGNNDGGVILDAQVALGVLTFATVGSEHMRITSTGNVGIGTTSPAGGKLHIVSTGDELVRLEHGSSTGNPLISFIQSGTRRSYIQFLDSENNLRLASEYGIVSFLTGNANNETERMRITSGGNVGIGTTSPAGKLSVVGDGTEYSNIVLRHSTNQEHLIYASTNVQYNLIGSSTPTWIWGQQGASERMRLNNTGLGIGTTTPSQKLEVAGSISASGDFYLDGRFFDTNNSAGTAGQVLSSTVTGTDWVSLSEISGVDGTGTANYVAKWSDTDTITDSIIYDNGTNVGIGTSSPAGLLHIYQPSGAGNFILSRSNNITGVNFQLSADSTKVRLNGYGDGLTFWTAAAGSGTNAVERMRIDASGNVGIGTTSPQAKLNVSGAGAGDGEIRISAGANNTLFGIYRITGDASTYDKYLIGYNSAHASQPNELSLKNIGGDITLYTGPGGSEAERMRITSTGNVGIGTTSIDERLHVQGNMKLEQPSGDIDFRYTSNGTNKYNAFYQASTDSYGVYYNPASAYRFFISGSGDVGIGTNTPAQKLEVNGGSSYPDIRISATGLTSRYMELGMDSAVQHSIGAFGTGTYLTFKTVGTDRMVIDATGNVGIGVTAASTLLTLSANLNNTVTFARDIDTVGALVHGVGTAGAEMWLHRDDITIGDGDLLGRLNFSGADGGSYVGASILGQASGAWSATNSKSRLIFETTSDGATSPSEKMRIQDNGNVGIGGIPAVVTHGPHLDIVGNRGTLTVGTGYFEDNGTTNFLNGARPLSFGYAGSEIMRIHSNGNVGIGTTSPSQKLHVVGKALITDDVQLTGSNPRIDFNSNGASSLRFYDTTNASERVRIDTAGNVGIGTTSPAYKLDIIDGQFRVASSVDDIAFLNTTSTSPNVYIRSSNTGVGNVSTLYFSPSANIGTSYIRGVAVGDSSITGNRTGAIQFGVRNANIWNDSALYIKENGNVGIGTTSPAQMLHLARTGADNYIRVEAGDQSSYYSGIMLTEAGINWGWALRHSAADDNLYISYQDNTPTFTDTVTFKRNGNVGIGTTVPSAKLDVAGAGYFSGESLSSGLDQTYTNVALIIDEGDYIYTKDSSTTLRKLLGKAADIIYIGQTGTSLIDGIQLQPGTTNGYVSFYNDSSEYARFQGGNLGIGTTSPADPLHIVTSGNDKFIRIENSSAYTGLWLNDSGTNNGWLVLSGYTNTTSPGDFAIREYGVQTSLTIKQTTGNVGIGTTSPTATLHVSGTSDVFLVEGSGSTANTTIMAIDGNNGRLFEISDDLSDSLFSVNTVAGLPVMEAFADNRVILGAYNQNDLVVTGSRVGIGTASPDYELDVAGDIGIDGYIHHNGDDSKIGFEGNDAIRIYTANSVAMQIDSSQKVGIGTTSPQKKLEVISGGNDFVSVGVATLGVGNWTGIHFGYRESNTSYRKSAIVFERTDLTSNNAQGKIHILNGPQGSSSSATLADAKLTIAENGNVGIGTTSPSEKLHVSGSTRINGTIYSGDGSISASNSLQLSYSAASGIGTIAAKSTGGNTTLALQTSDSGTTADRFYIASNGNVGIGTTSPAVKLDILGSTNTSIFNIRQSSGLLTQIESDNGYANLFLYQAGGNPQIGLVSNGSSYFNGGNVGIGTTSPDVYSFGGGRILTVSSTSTYSVLVLASGNANSGGISMGNQTIRRAAIDHLDGSHLAFYTNNSNSGTVVTERMRITSGGNVGIGTTSPSTRLHVYDSSPLDHITIDGNNGDNRNLRFATENSTRWNLYATGTSETGSNVGSDLTIARYTDAGAYNGNVLTILRNSGNVGIGTTSPAQRLEVNGAILLQNNNELRWKDTGAIQRTIVRVNSSNELEYGWSGAGPVKFMGGGSYTERMRIHTNGNVGIGTSSPSAKLHVVKSSVATKYVDAYSTSVIEDDEARLQIIASDGGSNAAAITLSNGANHWSIHHRGPTVGNYLAFGYANSTSTTDIVNDTNSGIALALLNTGNVGIGTTNPSEKLVVNGPVVWQGALVASQTNSGVLDRSGNDLRIRAYGATSGTGNLVFRTGGGGGAVDSEAMRITSSGNVGIGTTVPGAKTHISGGGFDIYLDYSTTNSSIGISSLKKTSGKSALVVGRAHSTNNSAVMRFDYVGDNNAANYLGLGFYANDDLMVIKPSGNVGIGTSSPDHSLQIERSDNDHLKLSRSGVGSFELGVASSDALTFSDGGTERMRIDSSGNVGIGTTSPSAKLQISNGNNSNVQLLVGEGSTYGAPSVRFVTASPNYMGLGFTTGSVVGNEVLDAIAIQRTGNVGIGTTSPSNRLVVDSGATNVAAAFQSSDTEVWINLRDGSSGTASNNYGVLIGHQLSTGELLKVADSSITTKFLVTTSGNVGIGTTSPGVALDVVGAIRATGDVTAFYSSDERLKENKQVIENPIEKIKQISGYEFDWIPTEGIHTNEGHDIGVIAQEVEKVLPEIVATRDNGYKAVRYEKMVAVLIEAVKDLQKQIDELKSK